jgi:hypothetical protein
MAGPDAAAQWERFTIKDRRTVVKALVNVVTNPSTAATRKFNPKDIEISWKSSP